MDELKKKCNERNIEKFELYTFGLFIFLALILLIILITILINPGILVASNESFFMFIIVFLFWICIAIIVLQILNERNLINYEQISQEEIRVRKFLNQNDQTMVFPVNMERYGNLFVALNKEGVFLAKLNKENSDYVDVEYCFKNSSEEIHVETIEISLLLKSYIVVK